MKLLARWALFWSLITGVFVSRPAANAADEITPADVERFLNPWMDVLERTRKPAFLIALKPGKDGPLRSKVGGAPYMPPGASVPRDEKGNDMFLLSQINFAELPANAEYPKSGILQFFIAANDYHGANFDTKQDEHSLSRQRNFRIVFHERVSAESSAVPLPSLDNARRKLLPFDPATPLLMSFERTSEMINAHDLGFEKAVGQPFLKWSDSIAEKNKVDDELFADAVQQYLGPNDFEHKLGGYPSFVQEDPRKEDTEYVLLLQLSSDQELRFMWGDLGVAGFFIRPEDLKRRNFGNVLYSWDCS